MEILLNALQAIERGNVAVLSELLADDPTLAEARDGRGLPLVMHALYGDCAAALERLLACNPTLDLPTAAALGQDGRVAELLAAGADPAAAAPDGFEPLHLACYFGRGGVARLLLAAGADPGAPAAGHPSGVAPLASAVAGGHVALVELLLAHGAPPSPRQAGGFTPLHAAAGRGDRTTCERLLAAGARPGEADDRGADAAAHAARQGHGELAADLR
jgi:uncharacterized protein